MSTPGFGSPGRVPTGPGRVNPSNTGVGGAVNLFSQGLQALNRYVQMSRFQNDRNGLVAEMHRRLGPDQGALVRITGRNGAYTGMSVYFWGSAPNVRPETIDPVGTEEGWIWVRHDGSSSCPGFFRFFPTPAQMKVSEFARLGG